MLMKAPVIRLLGRWKWIFWRKFRETPCWSKLQWPQLISSSRECSPHFLSILIPKQQTGEVTQKLFHTQINTFLYLSLVWIASILHVCKVPLLPAGFGIVCWLWGILQHRLCHLYFQACVQHFTWVTSLIPSSHLYELHFILCIELAYVASLCIGECWFEIMVEILIAGS